MKLIELGNRRGCRVEKRIVKGDWGFPGGSVDKESMCNAGDSCSTGDLGFIPWVQKIPLEKEMATHDGIVAWRISWTEEPGRRQSMESQRVGHDWVT